MEIKFKIGEMVKIKDILVDGNPDNMCEIENIYKFKDSIYYELKGLLYPFPETLFESLSQMEKLEIIIKDNCKMIDMLIAGVALLIKRKENEKR